MLFGAANMLPRTANRSTQQARNKHRLAFEASSFLTTFHLFSNIILLLLLLLYSLYASVVGLNPLLVSPRSAQTNAFA